MEKLEQQIYRGERVSSRGYVCGISVSSRGYVCGIVFVQSYSKRHRVSNYQDKTLKILKDRERSNRKRGALVSMTSSATVSKPEPNESFQVMNSVVENIEYEVNFESETHQHCLKTWEELEERVGKFTNQTSTCVQTDCNYLQVLCTAPSIQVRYAHAHNKSQA